MNKHDVEVTDTQIKRGMSREEAAYRAKAIMNQYQQTLRKNFFDKWLHTLNCTEVVKRLEDRGAIKR